MTTPEATDEAIDDLRDKPPLPARLGVAKSELASDLAIRTITHAGMVAVAALRTAGTPMGDSIGALRAPLLPIAGTVARDWRLRASVAATFVAFALWIWWRCLATEAPYENDKRLEPAIADVSPWEVSVTVLAVLGVVVLAGVAGWRAWRRKGLASKAWYGGLAAALLASGFLVPVVLAIGSDNLQADELLAQSGAEDVPDVLLIVIVATSLGIPGLVALAGSRVRYWKWVEKALGRAGLRPKIEKFIRTPYAGLPTLALIGIPWLLLGACSACGLVRDPAGGWWTTVLVAAQAAVVAGIFMTSWSPKAQR